MQKRDLVEAGAQPAGRRLQRIMKLEIAFAVAVIAHLLLEVGRQIKAGKQAVIELVRRDRADDTGARRDLCPIGQLHALDRAISAGQQGGDIGLGPDLTISFADQRCKGIEQFLSAALDDWRPCGFQSEGDDLRHLRRIGAFRPESGMQDPGRPQSAGNLGLVIRFKPGPGGGESLAEELRHIARAPLPGLTRQQFCSRPAPQLTAEQREKQRRIALDPADIGEMPRAITHGELIQCRAIGTPRHGDDGRASVRQEHAGGMIAMAEFQSVPAKIGSQGGIGRRCDEEDEGCRHHVMDITRLGDLLAADAAADPVIALENKDALAALAQHCC